MARYTGPKNRLARREGVNLGLRSGLAQKLERRINVLPGQHGRRGRRKVSEYGLQLREKQKVKAIYGILERQFRKYFGIATKTKSATGETLLQILERRLDNVIYRMGIVPTRNFARQIISHKHVFVNGKKNNIPSFLVKVGDVVSLGPKAQNMLEVKKLLEEKEYTLPQWLERKVSVGKIKRLPERSDIDSVINEQLIVEFYSR